MVVTKPVVSFHHMIGGGGQSHTYQYISHHRSSRLRCTQTETLPANAQTFAVPYRALKITIKKNKKTLEAVH